MRKSDWILDLLNTYKRNTLKDPVFISDWDTLNENAEYPFDLITKALNISPSETLAYNFSDEQHLIKQLIVDDLSRGNAAIQSDNLAISISATAAIYLSIVALYRKGARRFLLFTPVYYSIIETLKDLGAEIFYYDLKDASNFEIDILALRKQIVNNKIEMVLLSDPVYCVGKDISVEVLNMVATSCSELNIWLFLDNTLGGMEWEMTAAQLFNYDKINILNRSPKFVMVDSLTKRLLVNGLKHAVIIANKELITEIEDFASQVYGGFCVPQLSLMTELYDPNNKDDVINILQHNVDIISNNYALLNTFLVDSPFKLYQANSGYFTMIVHADYKCGEVDITAQVQQYLFKHNAFLLPPWYFNFNDDNQFGIRVNLLKEPSTYLFTLGECIRENMELLH